MKVVLLGALTFIVSGLTINHNKQFVVRNNLEAENWVYGSMSEQQLKK